MELKCNMLLAKIFPGNLCLLNVSLLLCYSCVLLWVSVRLVYLFCVLVFHLGYSMMCHPCLLAYAMLLFPMFLCSRMFCQVVLSFRFHVIVFMSYCMHSSNDMITSMSNESDDVFLLERMLCPPFFVIDVDHGRLDVTRLRSTVSCCVLVGSDVLTMV